MTVEARGIGLEPILKHHPLLDKSGNTTWDKLPQNPGLSHNNGSQGLIHHSWKQTQIINDKD